MTEKKAPNHSVRAWVASTEQAKDISAKDLEVIQTKFDNKLTVDHMNDGGIAIYPSQPGDRSHFDTFMERNGAFEQKPIYLSKI